VRDRLFVGCKTLPQQMKAQAEESSRTLRIDRFDLSTNRTL
jgi:hypothetical protein